MTPPEANTDPQASFEESDLESPAVLAALERWQGAKDELASAKEDMKNAQKNLDVAIADEELGPGTYRLAQFLVKVEDVAAHQRVKPKLDLGKKKKATK